MSEDNDSVTNESPTSETVGSPNPNGYGDDGVGTAYTIGGNTLWVNDRFTIATLLAIVAVLNTIFEGIDDTISTVAERIYNETQERSN
jgi:hypothetical protein